MRIEESLPQDPLAQAPSSRRESRNVSTLRDSEVLLVTMPPPSPRVPIGLLSQVSTGSRTHPWLYADIPSRDSSRKYLTRIRSFAFQQTTTSSRTYTQTREWSRLTSDAEGPLRSFDAMMICERQLFASSLDCYSPRPR